MATKVVDNKCDCTLHDVERTDSRLDTSFRFGLRARTRHCLSLNSTGPTRTPTLTPTRTSSPTSARGSSRGSRRGMPRRARKSRGRFSSPTCLRTFVRHARYSSRGCPLGMRACTRVRVLYMINYRVYTFTKLHDRRIPNVGVRVGPVGFQL